MALPSSGALSLSNIQTEFGGSNPIGLSEYYAGGAYVPAGTSGTYGAVPSSGAISIRNFYGTSKVTLTIPASTITITGNVSGSVYGTAGAKLAFGYWGDGSYGQLVEGNNTSLGNWVTPGSAMSNYEFYATITATNGVGFTQGTYGTWLSADAAGFFGVEATAYNTLSTRSLTIQVRNKTTLATVGTFTANTSAYWSYP